MRPLEVVLTLTFVSAGASLACAPPNYWKEPVGVSDKAEIASDQSIDLDGGGDNAACARSPELVEGRPCAPEGAVCGNQSLNTLVCRDGAWDREDLPSTTAPPASAKPAKP